MASINGGKRRHSSFINAKDERTAAGSTSWLARTRSGSVLDGFGRAVSRRWVAGRGVLGAGLWSLARRGFGCRGWASGWLGVASGGARLHGRGRCGWPGSRARSSARHGGARPGRGRSAGVERAGPGRGRERGGGRVGPLGSERKGREVEREVSGRERHEGEGEPGRRRQQGK
jgi:hypothetical protein